MGIILKGYKVDEITIYDLSKGGTGTLLGTFSAYWGIRELEKLPPDTLVSIHGMGLSGEVTASQAIPEIIRAFSEPD